MLLYVLKLIEPVSLPQNIYFSNITDHQVTITWTTAKPTRAKIFVSKDGKFPLLPFLSKDLYKDDGEKLLAKNSFYTVHKITVGNLEPGKRYLFRIYYDWKRVYEDSFQTGPSLSSITAPSPVYGRIVKADGKSPLAGVLILLQAATGKNSSSFLSTLTNKKGRWSLDLGNLRNKDLTTSFKIASSSAEQLIIQTSQKSLKAQTKAGEDKPWPEVVFK